MITHVYSFYISGDPEEERRKAFARSTWQDVYQQGGWLPLPVLDESLPRLFKEGKRRLVYVKDLIDEACKLETDYVCLTNSDTCAAPSLHEKLKEKSLVYCHRKNFHKLTRKLSQTEVQNCPDLYCGLDLFLFPKSWWMKIREDFPMMILGREAIDLVLQKAMEFDGGMSIDNLIYHANHGQPFWENPSNRYSLPGQLWNQRLATEWLENRGLDPADCGMKRYLKPQRPPINETPSGGWKIQYCGISRSSYSLELLMDQMKQALKDEEFVAPDNLRDIIIDQTLPENTWT